MCGLLFSYVGVMIMDRQWRICTAYTLEYKLDLFLVTSAASMIEVRGTVESGPKSICVRSKYLMVYF